MKKIIVSIIVILVVFGMISTTFASPCPLPSANTDAEINFSDFEWYSDYPSVIKKSEELGWNNVSGIFNPNGGCTTPHWSIIQEIAHCWAGSEKHCGDNISYSHIQGIAGYDDVYVSMFFIFTPGIGNYDNYTEPNTSQFYLAEYEFDVADSDTCYNDLVDKLESIYGEHPYTGFDNLISMPYKWWVNKDGAVVGIKNHNGHVTVVYCAPKSEEKLAEIEKWVEVNEIESAKGNINGL